MKILITNPFGIGDVIFSTPLIEILKKSYPGSFIGYVCNKRSSDLIKTNPYLDRIFVYEKDDFRDIWRFSKIECLKRIADFLKDIKREHFDISVDLSLNYQYSMFYMIIGIPTRLGFNYRRRGKFLTGKVAIESFDNKHVVEHYLDVIKPLGIDTAKFSLMPKIYPSSASLDFADKVLADNGIDKKRFLVGIAPGCGESWGKDAERRRWSRKNFALLARRIADNFGAKIVLIGNSKEVGICEEVRSMAGAEIINYCGKTTIEELLGLLSRCKLVVTNEGGLLHMAAGLGIKTVSLFGPVDENTYGPYPASADHVMVSKKDIACRPCYRKFKYNDCDRRLCLDAITVEEVFGAAKQMLG